MKTLRCTNPRELAIALGIVDVTPQGEEYEVAAADGARKWLAEYGKRPNKRSGDATDYVGFSATWEAISDAFRRGSHGVRKLGGLMAFLDEQNIGDAKTNLSGKQYEQAVASGARKWLAEYGKRPSASSGDATDYVVFSTTWKAVNCAFRVGHYGARKLGGLMAFLDEQNIGEPLQTRKRK